MVFTCGEIVPCRLCAVIIGRGWDEAQRSRAHADLHAAAEQFADCQIPCKRDARAWAEVVVHEQHTIGGIALRAGHHIVLHFVENQLGACALTKEGGATG